MRGHDFFQAGVGCGGGDLGEAAFSIAVDLVTGAYGILSGVPGVCQEGYGLGGKSLRALGDDVKVTPHHVVNEEASGQIRVESREWYGISGDHECLYYAFIRSAVIVLAWNLYHNYYM